MGAIDLYTELFYNCYFRVWGKAGTIAVTFMFKGLS